MTVLEAVRSDISDAGFRLLYGLDRVGGEFDGGVQGLAGILGWNERKTGRILKELVAEDVIRVERRYKMPSRIFISDTSDRPAEPAPVERSDKIGGSVLTDSDSTVQTEQNSQSEAFERANLSDLGDQILETDPADDLRVRLEALAFRGIGWALRTFEPDVLLSTVATVEALARDGIAYNPGGLVNAALRGKVLLFRPESPQNAGRAPESAGERRSPEVPTVDPEREQKAEEQRKHYAAYWAEFKAKRDRYPADHNAGYQVPDTYHPELEPEEIGNFGAGIAGLRAGLDRAKVVA